MTALRKPVSAATRAMLDEMEEADGAVSTDKLDQARDLARKLRDYELDAETLDARLTEVKASIREMKERTIPNFFDEAGVPSIKIAADGNMPEYEISIFDRFYANIPDETKDEAFAYLTKTKNEDLIKTVYTISFGLKEGKASERFASMLEKVGIQYEARSMVPWNTLTAWFKAEHRKRPLPAKAMELLGATVGRVAKVVKQKERK